MKSTEELINLFTKLINKPCICSNDQLTGADPKLCKSCNAAGTLNRIGEILREEYKEIK